MNTKYILLNLVALLAACSESEDVLENHSMPRLTISSEFAEYGTTRAFSTGLGSETEFRQGNAIGVSLVTTIDKAYKYNDVPFNLKAIYGIDWSLENAPMMEKNKAKLYAYYPFTDSYNVQTLKSGSNHTGWTYSYFHSIPIDITPRPHGDGQQDYLWGESSDSVNCDNPHARIQFKHVLPRITFKVTKGNENADDEIYVRKAFLKAADESKNVIGTKGKLSIFSGQATMDTEQETTSLFNGYTAPVQIYPKEVTGEVRTFDFLVFPVSFKEGDVILSIETYKGKNGKLQTYDITLPAATWEAGKQYTYPVTLSVTGAEAETPVKNQTFTVNGVSFTMVGIEAGTFQMGASADGDNYTPVHAVTLTKNFYMGETEVTQALWYAVMGQKPTSNGSAWSSTFGLGDNYPAYWISYEDCEKFLAKLNQMTGKNFRFPTEAEWEFAAKGGNKSKGYTYAGSNTIDDVAWYYENSGDKTHVVKGKTANELGLYDMSGNLSEWCYDWYGSYSSTAQTDPTGPTSGSGRVYRGGSWLNYAGLCRVSGRLYHAPGTRGHNLGLRLAL